MSNANVALFECSKIQNAYYFKKNIVEKGNLEIKLTKADLSTVRR